MLRPCVLAIYGLTMASCIAAAEPPRRLQVRCQATGLIAIAVRVHDPELPQRSELDSTRVVIKRGKQQIAQHLFGGRLISKMLWSPDGQFLALCSESAGGHSPWHMNSYFWSRHDNHFRSVDYHAGLVTDSDFSFRPPHTLIVKVAPWQNHQWDANHPETKEVNLEQSRKATPPLGGDAHT